jgi:L-glyceraldehyde 3-phosphate reductase
MSKGQSLNELAMRRGQSLAQMAMAWTLGHKQVTPSLIGAREVTQVQEAVGALTPS